jgi:hypothetical protein
MAKANLHLALSFSQGVRSFSKSRSQASTESYLRLPVFIPANLASNTANVTMSY